MSQSDAGKTDKRRPCLVEYEEYVLRHYLAYGKIDRKTFDRAMRKLRGKK